MSLLLTDTSQHSRHFVTANGVRLQYLDWVGGTGRVLVLLHGLGDNPHVFDDLAPTFTDDFRVIAYARRGHGMSESKPPYDNHTLVEDLRGLMDALSISRADMAGWSLGASEITAMAAQYPDRVGRIVYLDGGYDYADPEFRELVEAIPSALREIPSESMRSLDAFYEYVQALQYPSLDSMDRVAGYLGELISVDPNGQVTFRMSREVEHAFFESLWANPPRNYAEVQCAVLALYAQSTYDAGIEDQGIRNAAAAWEAKYMVPFREKSMRRIERELLNVSIVRVPGAHNSFFLTSRERVCHEVRQFLLAEQ